MYEPCRPYTFLLLYSLICRVSIKLLCNSKLTKIGEYAFNGCDSLKSIELPNGVTYIGDYAFYSCWNLTSINIPDSVTFIGDRAFVYCSNLAYVTFEDPEDWYVTETYVASSEIDLASEDLSDSAVAAEYLRRRYGGYYWYKR